MTGHETREQETVREQRVNPASTGNANPSAGREPARLSLSVQLGAEIDTLPETRARLRRWVAAAIESDAQITLRFTGIQEGRELNHRYRQRDQATNVLTFCYEGPPAVQADIAICLPVVEREAREQGKTLREHLAHLVAHGVLHASDYEHDSLAGARRMQARETEIMRRLRLPDPWAPTAETAATPDLAT